ncbi:MAG: rod-binding protein [Planctomycetota bacterium]
MTDPLGLTATHTGIFRLDNAKVPSMASVKGETFDGFASAFAAVERKYDAKEEARKAAEEFVAIALIKPVFQAMRKSPLMAEGPFKPGKHEQQFMGMLDEELSASIARSKSMPITDAVERQLLGDRGTKMQKGQ